MHGKRRVSARRGRAGEKSDFSASCQETLANCAQTPNSPLLVGHLSPLLRDSRNFLMRYSQTVARDRGTARNH